MYRRNLKAIIVAFVLVSGFGIGTAAHVSQDGGRKDRCKNKIRARTLITLLLNT